MIDQEPKKINRRQFIEISAKALAAVTIADSLSAHIGIPTLTSGFWEGLESGALLVDNAALQKSLNQQFNTAIISREENDISRNIKIDPEDKLNMIPWEGPYLKALERTLSTLPKHYYSPREITGIAQPLRFALYNRLPIPDAAGLYNPRIGFKSGAEIQISKGGFNQFIFNHYRSSELLVHEITHYVTDKYSFPSFAKKEVEIKNAVGLESVDDLRQAFTSVIEAPDNHPFKYVGYGAQNFDEFWAVAAEYYYRGASNFKEAYSEFLGEERAEILYNGVRDHIFRGQEYFYGTKL